MSWLTLPEAYLGIFLWSYDTSHSQLLDFPGSLYPCLILLPSSSRPIFQIYQVLRKKQKIKEKKKKEHSLNKSLPRKHLLFVKSKPFSTLTIPEESWPLYLFWLSDSLWGQGAEEGVQSRCRSLITDVGNGGMAPRPGYPRRHLVTTRLERPVAGKGVRPHPRHRDHSALRRSGGPGKAFCFGKDLYLKCFCISQI